jgi:hypothetical protein
MAGLPWALLPLALVTSTIAGMSTLSKPHGNNFSDL